GAPASAGTGVPCRADERGAAEGRIPNPGRAAAFLRGADARATIANAFNDRQQSQEMVSISGGHSRRSEIESGARGTVGTEGERSQRRRDCRVVTRRSAAAATFS